MCLELGDGAVCLRCGARPDAPDALIGATIADKFRIENLLGEGAVARVYRAYHVVLHKLVAFKLLRPGQVVDAEARERFYGEAVATSRLSHPNAVVTIDYGVTPAGQPYLVTEFLGGRSLRVILDEDKRLRPARAAHLAGQLLSALEDAHACGVLHRDVKPENLHVVTASGLEWLKVLDFGLAKIVEVAEPRRSRATAEGVVLGTPEYMSPEAVTGRPLDARSDLYSAGLVLYEMLTGVNPFVGGTRFEAAARRLVKTAPPPTRVLPPGSVPPAVDAFVARALAIAPADRFADARQMRAALMATLEGWGTREADVDGDALGRRARPLAATGAAVAPPSTTAPAPAPERARAPAPAERPASVRGLSGAWARRHWRAAAAVGAGGALAAALALFAGWGAATAPARRAETSPSPVSGGPRPVVVFIPWLVSAPDDHCEATPATGAPVAPPSLGTTVAAALPRPRPRPPALGVTAAPAPAPSPSPSPAAVIPASVLAAPAAPDPVPESPATASPPDPAPAPTPGLGPAARADRGYGS
ncbi:MAG TPA: protein kinase [Myxococcota bacterium]|nr:protein kinase [Myxococcota bacterium]